MKAPVRVCLSARRLDIYRYDGGLFFRHCLELALPSITIRWGRRR